jgi:hypothetical protein
MMPYFISSTMDLEEQEEQEEISKLEEECARE